MKTITDFLSAHPWILASLVPSLLVGLSSSPKTAGLVGAIKKLLQIFSLVTHSDEAGTFKLPLMTSHLSRKITSRKTTTNPTLPPAAPTVILLALLIPLTSCATFKKVEPIVIHDAIDCTVQAVRDQADRLLPAVLAILTGGAIDWVEQLDALRALGEDAVACAMQKAAEQVEAAPAPGEAEPQAKPVAVETRAKIKKYAADRKWGFKKK